MHRQRAHRALLALALCLFACSPRSDPAAQLAAANLDFRADYARIREQTTAARSNAQFDALELACGALVARAADRKIALSRLREHRAACGVELALARAEVVLAESTVGHPSDHCFAAAMTLEALAGQSSGDDRLGAGLQNLRKACGL